MSSFVFSGQGFASAELPLSPPFHPHSSLSDLFARCQLGVLVSAGAATCLSTSLLSHDGAGQAINAVTGTRLLGPNPRLSLTGGTKRGFPNAPNVYRPT